MNSYRERKKKFWDKEKKQLVQKLMSSFAITVVVVVIAVTIATRIPKAKIIQVEAFGNDIYYEVEVIDDDYQIISGSLAIVATNATEYHEILLELGNQSGSFGSLKANTTYDIAIYADYGYGKGTLAASKVTTLANYGGKITNWQNIRFNTSQINESLLYHIYTSYNDLKGEISSVLLKYAYVYQDMISGELFIPDSNEFAEIPITNMQQTTLLSDVPNENVRIYLILEATLLTSEVVILDQKHFDTPLKLYSSLYVSDVGPNYLLVSFYPDYYQRQDIVYIVNLIKNGEVIDQKTFTAADFPQTDHEEYNESESIITFTNLLPLTKYHLQLIAQYPNLITEKEESQELDFFDTSTTPNYKIIYKSSKTENTIRLQIDLQDQNMVFSNFNYYMIKIVDGVESYVSSGTVEMGQLERYNYQGILTETIEPGYQYKIILYATKTIDSSLLYEWCFIKEILY